MPRQIRQRTILDVVTNTYGGVFYLGKKAPQHLFVISITGTATVTIQGREENGPWRVLGSMTSNNEVNLNDYGWYEVRALSSGMVASTVKVVWSWK